MMIVFNLYKIIKEILMNFVNINKLRRDISKASNYQRRLLEKGKHTLAYKMGKKIEQLELTFADVTN